MDYEGKDGPHSPTGGVKAFPIATRFVRERERLAGGFTDADRALRKQYLKDQILNPNEPVRPEWMRREMYNPIRRLYKFPLRFLFKPLKPHLGEETFQTLRYCTGKFFVFIGAVYVTAYWLKYNGNDWTKKGGWLITQSHDMVMPGSSEPLVKLGAQPGSDYYDAGFKNSPI